RTQADEIGNRCQFIGHHIIVCSAVVLELVQTHIVGAHIDQEIMIITLVISGVVTEGINLGSGAHAVGSCCRGALNHKKALSISIRIGVVVINLLLLQIGG